MEDQVTCPKCQTSFGRYDERLRELTAGAGRYNSDAFAKVCEKCSWAWQRFLIKTEEYGVMNRIDAEEFAMQVCFMGRGPDDIAVLTDRRAQLARERHEAVLSLRERCLVWLGSSTDSE